MSDSLADKRKSKYAQALIDLINARQEIKALKAQIEAMTPVVEAAINLHTYITHDAVIGTSGPRIDNILKAVEAYADKQGEVVTDV